MSRTAAGRLPSLAPSWWTRASSSGSLATPGSRAAFAWLAQRSIPAPASRWHVAIGLDVRDEPATATFDETVDTRFHIEVYAEEWGFFFCHGGRASWIRITDVAFVHLRDDFALLASTPALERIGTLLRAVEHEHALSFRRDLAFVNTSIAGAELAIRTWIASL